MDMQYYRDKVMHVPKYNNVKWQDRVRRMPDNQVYALYFKFKKDGLFDKKKTEKSPVEENQENFYQMTIFDLIKEDEQ